MLAPVSSRGQHHGRPAPGTAGEEQLGFGGAALTTSLAAQIRVCSPFGLLRVRFIWIAGVVLFLASAWPAAASDNLTSDDSAYSRPATTLDSAASANVSSSNPAERDGQQRPDQPPPAVVDRIIFIGNRRVRSDTLKARIFSREGDPYNEETLRRDFQALWNTQFFEDVKLRVEDSPDGPNHKNIIFDVKERPVIRRIRYDGIHSISESDILDRFKERKVGLTVESSFDPTRIKKAEVVLQELLGEHGRQFAK